MEFVKYTGAGNDFVLVDNRDGSFPIADCTLIRQLCDRHFGIGADGLLLLEGARPWQMRLLQADGLEAKMCGNGMRCFKAYLDDLGLAQPTETIVVDNRSLTVTTKEDGQITVEMGAPLTAEFGLVLDGLLLDRLNTGVPHLVIQVDDIATAPLLSVGPKLRHHPEVEPEGANVNFVQLIEPRRIAVRTYERGVEKETKACGTGVTASALATAYHLGQKQGPITAQVASGSVLTVHFHHHASQFTHVTLTGPAQRVFAGCWD